MLRHIGLVVFLACASPAIADNPRPIELTVAVIDMQSQTPAGGDNPLALLSIGDVESDDWPYCDDWLDEVARLRSTGVDVRIRRVSVTAYDGLPARIQLFDDDHVCDDTEHDDGTRRQAILDLSCTPTRRDDGKYSLEISFSDQTRDDAPWEEPVLQDVPAESSFPPFERRRVTTSLDVRPDEWLTMGGTHSEQTDECGLRTSDANFILVRVAEDESSIGCIEPTPK
jgi:hypothetical protein